MKLKMHLDMFGIITTKFAEMKAFYRDVLGLEVVLEMENYVEFKQPNVRLAISTNEVMTAVTKHPSFQQPKQGQALELAFIVAEPAEVDAGYKQLIEQGATAVTAPADMPWGQRAAFFADPDGNIHEIFCNLAPVASSAVTSG